MLIEFLGMPGNGKTTLARGLAADLAQHGYDATLLLMDAPVNANRYVKLGRQLVEIARYSISHPHQATCMARVLRYFPQPNLMTFAKASRYWLLTSAIIARHSRQAQIVVCDQGFGQGLFSLALQAPSLKDEAFNAALRLIPTPGLTILVTTDQETTEARLRERRYAHRWVDKLLLSDRGCWERAARIVEHIIAALRAADRPLTAYASSRTRSVAADTRELAAVVRRHLQRGAEI